MNISQHAIIPLGYPSQIGYYNSTGNLVNSTNYVCTQKFGTYGCNRFYRSIPVAAYGNVRGWDNSSVEPVPSANVSLNNQKDIFDFNPSFDNTSFMCTTNSAYSPYVKYPFLVFFKDNSSAVTSLSLGNPFSPDVMEDEEEMI